MLNITRHWHLCDLLTYLKRLLGIKAINLNLNRETQHTQIAHAPKTTYTQKMAYNFNNLSHMSQNRPMTRLSERMMSTYGPSINNNFNIQ